SFMLSSLSSTMRTVLGISLSGVLPLHAHARAHDENHIATQVALGHDVGQGKDDSLRNSKQMAVSKRNAITAEAAESLAVQALAFLAAEPEQLGRFLAITGIGPDGIRSAAREPQFLAGVLESVAGDEPLLV